MVNKKFLLGMLVMALVFGMIVVGCDLLTPEKYGLDTINGVWHYDQSENTVITISDGVGTLTSLDGYYTMDYSPSDVGETVLRNIVFKGNADNIYYECEFYRGWWGNTYISYSKENKSIYIYTYGGPYVGMGYTLKK